MPFFSVFVPSVNSEPLTVETVWAMSGEAFCNHTRTARKKKWRHSDNYAKTTPPVDDDWYVAIDGDIKSDKESKTTALEWEEKFSCKGQMKLFPNG